MTAETLIPLEEEALEEDMPTFEHGVICTNLNYQLRKFVEGKNLGRVVDSSTEYRFLDRKNKKLRRSPDVSFVSQARLPKRFRSYPDIAPDLAIEVESPTDKGYELEAKVTEYQKAGIKLVWIIHPFSRTVTVYHLANGLTGQIYGSDAKLSGEDIIEGFELPLSEIFDYPPDPDEEPEELENAYS